jgi:RNase H-like domain found in reverse transcriptase
MINFLPGELVILETHTGPKGLAAVYLQRDPAGGRWLPVAAYSRELHAAELEMSMALLELTVM